MPSFSCQHGLVCVLVLVVGFRAFFISIPLSTKLVEEQEVALCCHKIHLCV